MKADPAAPSYWASRWQSGETGWDQGGPHPCLDRLIEQAQAAGGLPLRGKILEPGCGRAHTGAELARRGFVVTAFDVVERAIEEARSLYGHVPGLTLTTANALESRPEWRGAFDAIYDRAMMCALPPEKRRAYGRAVFEHLRPGGFLLSVVVAERREKPELGPPFAVSADVMQAMLAPGFRRIFADERVLSMEMGGNAAKELCSVWQRLDMWDER